MNELELPEAPPAEAPPAEAPPAEAPPAEAPLAEAPPAEAPAAEQPAPSDAPATAQIEAPADGTKKVEGRDPTTVRLKRAYEAEVENKVASDYSHIVLAYGIIWSLFAIYGILLWRRSSAQKADIEALRAKQAKS